MGAFAAGQVKADHACAHGLQILRHQTAKISIAACDQCCFEHETPPMKLSASCRQGAQIGKFESTIGRRLAGPAAFMPCFGCQNRLRCDAPPDVQRPAHGCG